MIHTRGEVCKAVLWNFHPEQVEQVQQPEEHSRADKVVRPLKNITISKDIKEGSVIPEREKSTPVAESDSLTQSVDPPTRTGETVPVNNDPTRMYNTEREIPRKFPETMKKVLKFLPRTSSLTEVMQQNTISWGRKKRNRLCQDAINRTLTCLFLRRRNQGVCVVM